MGIKHLTQTPPAIIPRIPSIRLISATPSATGLSSTEGSTSIRVFDDSMSTSATPWDGLPPPPPLPQLKHSTSKILPKTSSTTLTNTNLAATATAKRLIPKKSKMGLLGSIGGGNSSSSGKENGRSKDFSDVVRRVAAGNASQASSTKLKGGFEIYVDPAGDPDMSDVLVVKKQKSRAALDDMGWGPAKGVLGEVTNQQKKEGAGLLKVKVDEERKWWSIGRGRKDSKEEKKTKDKSSSPQRSQTPDPFKSAKAQQPEPPRTRFNSLDAGLLLGLAKKKSKDMFSTPTIQINEESAIPSPAATIRVSSESYPPLSCSAIPQLHPQVQPKKLERVPTPPQAAFARSATTTMTFGGLLAPPTVNGGLAVPTSGGGNTSSNQDSIALRAMRSVRSLARIGSWAQVGKGEEKEGSGNLKKENVKSVNGSSTISSKKDKKEKKKEKEKIGEEKDEKRKSKKVGLTVKKRDMGTLRASTSSFEAGALSSSPPPAESISKKRSILGLGLPSSMRLPNMRQGSSASSILAPHASSLAPSHTGSNFSAVSSASHTFAAPAPATTAAAPPTSSRLSVDSTLRMDPLGRRASIQSTGSSLRPVSITSTISGASTAGSRVSSGVSTANSVRWDEEGLERAKAERRERERDSMGSVRSRRRDSKDGKTTAGSRRSLEGRRRTPISEVFPEIVGGCGKAEEVVEVRYPIVTIEEATADGHGDDLDGVIVDESAGEEDKSKEVVATPVKKPRARPLSEQLLGRSRPVAMHEDEDGVLSILSAATNDLAQLINNLDLEATPATPDMTPLKPSSSPFNSEPTSSTSVSRSLSLDYTGSPLKNKKGTFPQEKGVAVRGSMASISSLRPYAQSRAARAPTAPPGHSASVAVAPSPPATVRAKASFSEMILGKGVPSWPLPEKSSLAELRAGLKKTSASSKVSSDAVAASVPLPNAASNAAAAAAAGQTVVKTRQQLPPFLKTHKRTATPGPEPDPAPVFEALRPPVRQQRPLKMSMEPGRVRDAFDDSDKEDKGEEGDWCRTVRGKQPSEFTFGSGGKGSGNRVGKQKRSVGSLLTGGKKKDNDVSVVDDNGEGEREGVKETRIPISREARRILGMSGTMGGSDVSAYRVEIDESDPDSDVPEELRVILRREEAETSDYQGAGAMEVDDNEDEDDDADDSSFTGRLRFGIVIEDEDDMTMDIELPPSQSVSPLVPNHLFANKHARNTSVDLAEIHHAQRLPVFRAQLVTDTTAHDADIDDDGVTSSSDENSTKQSFDFTGELAKLNESGGGDRRSFVEQLENAFKTPAKVDLRAEFGIALDVPVPPVPALPERMMMMMSYDASVSMNQLQDSWGYDSSVGVGRDITGDLQMVEVEQQQQQQESIFTRDLSPSQMSENDVSVSRILDTKQPGLELPSLRSSQSTVVMLKLKASTSSAGSSKSGLSDGELNRSFRFGGVSSASTSPDKLVPESPRMDTFDDAFLIDEVSKEEEEAPRPLAEPPAHGQEISFSSSMLDEYEDSALQSTMSKAVEVPQDRQHMRKLSTYIPLTRPSSGVSFGGLDSFDEVRRGFEFHDYRPDFYPQPVAANANVGGRHRAHRRAQESVFSIASVSSYGRVIREGAKDPFDYGVVPPMPPMPSLRERSFEEDGDRSDCMSFDMSSHVDDTFSFLDHRPVRARTRVDSDASSFYFNAAPPTRGHHRRRESNMSVSSFMAPPPISTYNNNGGGRSFGHGHHRRTSSVTSASSVALSYAHGGVMGGGRAILARHRRDASVDSIGSEFSSMRGLGRPGLGEKMFDMEYDYAGPLAAIAGSPSQSTSGRDLHLLSAENASYAGNRTSSSSFDYYDSILDNGEAYRYDGRQRERIVEGGYDEDEDERRSSMSDSLFDQTGENRSSVSSGSVFGNDDSQPVHGGLLPLHQSRPLSVISMGSVHSPMKEDDTMISMLGGGHVRRRSIGSMINASPCVRVEKRHNHRRNARVVYQGAQLVRTDLHGKEVDPSPVKMRTLELKPSIASSSSFQFGGERMIKARHGLLERQSLEDSVLVAEGEDLGHLFQAVPVFSRPPPSTRSRSSTCTSASESSGRDTPPLSASEGSSSVSGSSFSSLDMSEMDVMLSNTTHPVSTLAAARARARDHGHGHRRRYSKAHFSRSSVYETIEEEMSSAPSSPSQSISGSATKKMDRVVGADDSTAVYVVGSDTESIHDLQEGVWDDERGIVALRKFYHLKDEAQSTVIESQRTWRDTPFSVYAVQAFEPPRNPDGMKALLEHSLHNYVPLPAELRRMRSRKNSRPSPYPQTRFMPTTMPSPVFERPQPSKPQVSSDGTPVLKDKKMNGNHPLHVAPSLEAMKPLSPFVLNITEHSAKKPNSNKGSTGPARPRVPSATRRSALGWSKRSNGAKSSTSQKENVIGDGSISTPGESLRLNRPRPRGRTPASQARPIRV